MIDFNLFFHTLLFVYWFSFWQYFRCCFSRKEKEENADPIVETPEIKKIKIAPLNFNLLKEPDEMWSPETHDLLKYCVSPSRIMSPPYDSNEIDEDAASEELEVHYDRVLSESIRQAPVNERNKLHECI